MGLSQRPRLKIGAFTLPELLVVLTITSLLGALVISLFSSGLFYIRRSSGRIDLVRRARLCMDNTQRYLSGAVRPNESGVEQAFRDPRIPPPAFDPTTSYFYDDLHPQNVFSRVPFWTAIDYVGGAPLASARQLQMVGSSGYFVYELAEVPGPDGEGNDVVLRRCLPSALSPVDGAVQPRVIARDLGVLDEVTGDYRDAFVVRILSNSAVQLQVAATGSRIHGELEAKAASQSDLMTVRLTTIVQLPFYSSN